MKWKWADLPPSLLLAVFSYLAFSEALPEQEGNTPNKNKTDNTPFFSAANGTGVAYARSCQSAYSAYSSGKSSWDAIHNTVETTTVYYGGTAMSQVTYYENATTLCDGHPRVLYSPAIPLSTEWRTTVEPTTATSVYTDTVGRVYSAPSPSCTIRPQDCDPLWSDYSKSVAAAATITPAPVIQTPPCMNQSAASSWSSVTEKIYGCGLCTIYGEGVELVYFPEPTTVSRDMCAETPTASLTSYGPGAVITAYAGKSFGANMSSVAGAKKTVVADGHTFTTGTAYISISKVYAANRCSKTFGVVNDAILAMPSESVLSLRYSQDHFQRLMETDKITGYPVSYADFNTPIPWSAWNGQNQCLNQLDTITCGVIYETYYRPQLAIPPEITSLSPDFEGCQMWYNGLWDPPLALTEAVSAEGPTLPGGHSIPTSTAAQPSQAPPTTQPTAIPNELPSTYQNENGPTLPNAGGPTASDAGPSGTDGGKPAPSYGDNNSGGHKGGQEGNGEHGTDNNNQSGGKGGSGEEADHSGHAGHEGQSPRPRPKYVPSKEPWTKDVKIRGKDYTAKAEGNKVTIGPITCIAGGAPQMLPDGTVCSYGENGLVFTTKEKVVFDDQTPDTATSGQTGVPDSQPDTDSSGASGPSGETNSNDGAGSTGTASNPTRTGDSDTVTITINGEKETAVQEQDGGPVVIEQRITLLPGGPPVTFPDGTIVSVPQNGSELVIQTNSTLGVEPTTTGDSSVSGAIRSGLGYGGQSSSASTAPGSGQPAETGGSGGGPSQNAAAGLFSFEALNFLVVLGTLVVVLLG
ncbi:hypothetical protein CB0940_05555 [Cercospora beticola]|uniref:Uncharacterized protein n=1 Tax=Cercospora beticola TaxID=122368 RepID=A0A2G5HY34_CERBT|nr:hypothetical protein CB0940_05555 [Cercospora beticola]PIA97193.1 hypothetical protein CB0940_05555 [Cercospora beticola]WPA98114.1 hypothetical protein RHO25_002725 [Cercospora beticola]CAK1359328.1 unnamed protein product [Cercospora beticola]